MLSDIYFSEKCTFKVPVNYKFPTLLFIPSSFMFISHLTNFLSNGVFMYVACFFMSHFAFEKEPARFETDGH